ncbi:MAG: GNAT family N-acetyltransferase [Clostridiaceae bacterium]|jgi:ribosomal protein S18 acetylase RimI-like enzyme|nr:GNAT family N-acetyltransferase [Clostridiaceae bacterium]
MCSIHKVEKSHIEELNRIAYESEAWWGYDSEFMEKFKAIYKITEDYIRDNPTLVLIENGSIIGFFSFVKNENETELEYFYIDPQYIGKGYGKKMWDNLVDYCKATGIYSFSLVTSPQAKGFYEKMGAVVTDEVESLLRKGRKIPKLRYTVHRFWKGKT